jgi:hypothetical protein
MKNTVGRCVTLLLGGTLLLTAAGCRQPDGTMPSPQGDQTNRIGDISRDLQNLAAKDVNAPNELYDDLTYLEATPRPEPRLRELSQALATALGGTKLSDEDATAIANHLFVAVSGRELSEAQVEQVGDDLRASLVGVGADAQAAERAAVATTALAGEVSENKKRWYHR